MGPEEYGDGWRRVKGSERRRCDIARDEIGGVSVIQLSYMDWDA